MTDKHVQFIALFLIVFAALCIGAGEHFGMSHLVDFAGTFGGGGVGILTGQKLSSVTNRGDGTMNVNPTQ